MKLLLVFHNILVLTVVSMTAMVSLFFTTPNLRNVVSISGWA